MSKQRTEKNTCTREINGCGMQKRMFRPVIGVSPETIVIQCLVGLKSPVAGIVSPGSWDYNARSLEVYCPVKRF